MSPQGIYSNSVNLRGQDDTTSQVAVYEFDLDTPRWHKAVDPRTGKNGWRGIYASFPDSNTGGKRPWQLVLRFNSWNGDYNRSLGVRVYRNIPERRHHIAVVDKKDDAEKKAMTEEPAQNQDATSLYNPSRLNSLPTGLAESAKKKNLDDDLSCTPAARNALLVYLRLFSISYTDTGLEMELVQSLAQTKEQLRESNPEQKSIEMTVRDDKLRRLPKTVDKKDSTTTRRWLRLEVTTVFNHDYGRTMQPYEGHSVEFNYDRIAGQSLRKAPHDVRLFFPSVGKDGAELWTSEEILRDLSPYYEDLFSSGFSEATTRLGKRPRLTSPSATAEVSHTEPDASSQSRPGASTSSRSLPIPSAPSGAAPASSDNPPSMSAPAPSSEPPTFSADHANTSPKEGLDSVMAEKEEVSTLAASASHVQLGEKCGDGGDKTMAEQEDDVVLDEDGHDSDNEIDRWIATEAPELFKPEDSDADLGYRQIVVKGTAWSTYYALLAYATTDKIRFAKDLASSRINTEPETSTEQVLRNCVYAKSPFPVSPKSVFKLAQRLQLDENFDALSGWALDAYRKRLTVDNVVKELFSSTAQTHEEIRDEAKQFAIRNWSEVKRTEGKKEIREKVFRGELPYAAPTLMELLDAKLV
ncbi:hypothetical protein JCM11641_006253 [Rhodosporidiobolus odoratus]